MAERRSRIKRYCLDARTAVDHFPGIGRYVSNLARELARLLTADEQLLLLTGPPRATTWALPPPGAQVLHQPADGSPFSLRQQWLIPRLLRARQADLYHSPYFLMPYLTPVPALLTVYDLIPALFPQLVSRRARLFTNVATRLALRRAAHVIAISNATRADFLRRYSLDPGAVSTVYLAADARFQPPDETAVTAVRRRYRLPARYILFVGSNKPHKNLPPLVQLWAAESWLPPLVIAGPWDDRYPQIQSLVRQHNLQERVLLLGPLPETDLPALYGGALCFVFPSLYEGFGLPVIEAMACGTAVICSNRSSLPEIAADAALLFDPETMESLGAALRRLLHDDVYRRRLAAAGRQRAARFSWQQTAAQTLAIYRQMV